MEIADRRPMSAPISQVPEINRFIINKQFYNRTELTCAMVVLMDTEDGSVKENTIKVRFDPSDTILRRAGARAEHEGERKPQRRRYTKRRNQDCEIHPEGSGTDLRASSGFLRFLDRYGILPGFLIDELPFHTGLWLTNNASIGLEKRLPSYLQFRQFQPVFWPGYAGPRIHRGCEGQSRPLCQNSHRR